MPNMISNYKKDDVMLVASHGADNNTRFWVQDGMLEVLRLEGNGDIYVHGRLAANDQEVVEALRLFLTEAKYIKNPDAPEGK